MNKKADRKTRLVIFLACLVLFIGCSASVSAQGGGLNDFHPTNNTTFTSATQFNIPNRDSTVTFASGGSYGNATLDGDTWNFAGLFVNGGLSVLPNINGVSFSVSATNTNVTITHLDVLNMVPPAPGKLEYSVSGVGTQAVNLHYSRYGLINWTVYIDGVAKMKGDGWTMTSDGWLNITGAVQEVSIQWAQPDTINFPAKDSYPIPDCNSSISFAYSGTYWGTPSFDESTWSFQNLRVNGSKPGGSVMWNFAVSAQNCNMTITAYNAGGLTGAMNVASWLNYTVDGVGVQRVNLYNGNLNGDAADTEALHFSVTIDGIHRMLGDGWRVLADGWIEITSAKADVSIYRAPFVFDGPAPSVSAVFWQAPSVVPDATTTVNELGSTSVGDGVSAQTSWVYIVVGIGMASAAVIVASVLLIKRSK
jgi:hypothetical protein